MEPESARVYSPPRRHRPATTKKRGVEAEMGRRETGETFNALCCLIMIRCLSRRLNVADGSHQSQVLTRTKQIYIVD